MSDKKELTLAEMLNLPILDTEHASLYTGLAVSTLTHDRIKEIPTIPFMRLGKAVRYERSALDAFMRSHRVSTESAEVAA